MQQLPEALVPMAAYKQFILYKIVPSKTRAGKFDKLPVDPRTLQVFEKGSNWQDDPNAWTDATNAISLAAACGKDYGIGFFITAADPFFFLDLDGCLQADGATWSPVAMDLLGRLPGAAVEISQSGSGLHVFGTGAVPDHGCKNVPLGLELYTERRFAALTGTGAMGSAAVDCSTTLGPLVASYFPPKAYAKDNEWTDAPVPEWTGTDDDDELIRKASAVKSAASVFEGGSNFAALWGGDADILAQSYLDNDRAYDASAADAALAQHLAFWTGKNCERMMALMWKSGLVRDKWEQREGYYLERTILRAVGLQETVYSVVKTQEPERIPVDPVNRAGAILEAPKRREGWQFLSIDGQIELFKGCVYIQDIHRVFTPEGALLKSEQVNATYGGYVFQLEDNASGKTTKKAWEAFTESQGIQYPIAHSLCFRPALAVGAMFEEEGRVLVNTYVPVKTERRAGDPGRFLDHLQRVLPVEQDRQILLAYMAACIQHIGVKFQWAPVIQGAPGNGKTLFTRCVAAAVGNRYAHFPKATDIDNKFNAWLMNKLFIGVEDIVVPDHKREVIEALKPMITNDRLEMQAKGADQIVADNFANFILNMNPRDGLRKDRNDRRFCVFYTKQQSADDIVRDGMGGDYFPKLYNWLKAGGYAVVANYLGTYPIPDELNPSGACHRAPVTSSTEEAVTASLGGIEQEILEAIDEGRPGFAGGWISSLALARLLDQMRAGRAIPPNKRRELLQSLGYDWHPALRDGRVNNHVAIDGGKPRLFIKQGHIRANIIGGGEVVRAYQEDQGATGPNGTAAQVFGNK